MATRRWRGGAWYLTHCWQRPGWPPLPPRFETEGKLPWAHAKVARGESFWFTSVDDLPHEAARDVESFRIHGPKSNVTIPLIANGQVFGALAFATLGEERKWREDEIAELKLVAQIIGNVLGRQRAEDRAEQLRAEIAHSTRAAMLGELAAALAHELNQPLTAILSNAQAARRFIAGGMIEADELRAILDDIVRDDKRAGGVIHNLRAMLNNVPVVSEPCCLNELVREVAEFLNGEMIGTEDRTAAGARAGSSARADGARGGAAGSRESFAQRRTRDEEHAIRVASYRDRDPQRRRHCESEHPRPRLWYSGRSTSDKIFNPFYTTKSSGLGMGLAICRRLIEAHGGCIERTQSRIRRCELSFSLPASCRAGRDRASFGVLKRLSAG